MKPNKYKAKKTTIDGIVFDSMAEGHRYEGLKYLQQGGEISDLELQPKFVFAIGHKKMFTYRADFQYMENGELIIEDVKGMTTPVFNLKKKIIEADKGIEIRLVDKHGNRKLTKTGRIKK